jgi:hypothetical protein
MNVSIPPTLRKISTSHLTHNGYLDLRTSWINIVGLYHFDMDFIPGLSYNRNSVIRVIIGHLNDCHWLTSEKQFSLSFKEYV